ncbi:unnamed protein product, partial [Bubo scandiacus]
KPGKHLEKSKKCQREVSETRNHHLSLYISIVKNYGEKVINYGFGGKILKVPILLLMGKKTKLVEICLQNHSLPTPLSSLT